MGALRRRGGRTSGRAGVAARRSELARLPPWARAAALGALAAARVAAAEGDGAEAPQAAGTCAPSTGARADLFAWVRARGGSVDGVRLAQDGLERSLVAERDLPEGHAVLKLPVQLVVTPQRAAASPLGRKLAAAADGQVQDLDGLVLAAWLLQQLKDEEPQWAPFLASLPASFPNLALNFSEDVMRQCASGLPHIESYLINGRAALERELRLFQSILGDETLERDRFLWARFVTFSRTFTVPRLRLSADEALREGLRPDVATFGSSGGEAAVLVPLADMINHAPASAVNCRWRYAGAEAGFTVATKRPLAAGEELLLSYGSKENKLFLAHYGFVAAGSPSDSLELELQLQPPREAAATSEEQQPGGERLRLSISGSQAAEVETLQEILEACRAAARRRHAAAALSEEELEAAAFRLLLAELAREAEPLRPSGACPAVCAGLRGNLLALLGTWGHFAERALALLPAGSEGAAADAGDGQESWGTLVGPYLLHARLYFGLWLRTYGRRLVDEVVVGWEVMAEASEFSRVSYVDLAPELDIDVEGG